MNIIRKPTLIKVVLVILCVAFLVGVPYAVGTTVEVGDTITVSASASDSDCDYTGECPASVGDSVTITWSDDTGRPTDEAFPNGNTGTSVTWKATCYPDTIYDTGTTKYIILPKNWARD